MKANHGTLVAALAILLAACAPSAMDDASGPRAAAPAATINVENHNWADMTVYLVQGTSRVRLGLVTGNSRATFRVPHGMENYPGQLRLLADPVGGIHTFLSDGVQIRPGQRVALDVGDNINVSFVSVRN